MKKRKVIIKCTYILHSNLKTRKYKKQTKKTEQKQNRFFNSTQYTEFATSAMFCLYHFLFNATFICFFTYIYGLIC